MQRLTPSLHTRISFVLTALTAALLLALGGLWLKQSRAAIHEEVEAASRVAEQWLSVAALEARAKPPAWSAERLLAHVQAVGRVRANTIEVVDSVGKRQYLSPQPSYKAGRAAPAWFAALVEPEFADRHIDAGSLTLILHPDGSRATLDAWDDLCAMAGWAGVLLIALFFAARRALNQALRPLGQVMEALDRTGGGRFDTRLPVFPVPELGRLASAFNGMADRLTEAVNENVRLETDQALVEHLQQRLEAERRGIARELHDELAQGITAVRALAGAVAQRTSEQPAIHGHAQSIIAVTGQMQDGVRNILHRLRPASGNTGPACEEALSRYLQVWQQHYPNIILDIRLDTNGEPLDDALTQALLRIVQEGLTNVVRHAAASEVSVELRRLDGAQAHWIEIEVSDNGCGIGASNPAAFAGCGLGLTGMRERIAALAGELHFDSTAGGTRLLARLPIPQATPLRQTS